MDTKWLSFSRLLDVHGLKTLTFVLSLVSSSVSVHQKESNPGGISQTQEKDEWRQDNRSFPPQRSHKLQVVSDYLYTENFKSKGNPKSSYTRLLQETKRASLNNALNNGTNKDFESRTMNTNPLFFETVNNTKVYSKIPGSFTPMPMTNRERYLTSPSPLVLLNNHKPRPYSIEVGNPYNWVLRPLQSHFNETLDASVIKAINQTIQTSNSTFLKEYYKNSSAKPTILLHSNVVVVQTPTEGSSTRKPQLSTSGTKNNVSANPVIKKGSFSSNTSAVPSKMKPTQKQRTTTTIRPYYYTAETSTATNNHRPISHSVTVKRPSSSSNLSMFSLSTEFANTIANLFRNSLLGTFLLMIPTAFLAMAFL